MNAATVVYLPDAVDDLQVIWSFVAEQAKDPAIADRLIDNIDDTARVFAANPDIGTPRPDLADELRSFVAGRYVVLYSPIPNGIEIVQVIHGARDVPTRFRGKRR